MNYIKEINAFIDWLETNPMEASTQTLWFHLMGIANKSGWPEWFTVANLTLQAKVGVTENTLSKHRNILVQRGRLEYRGQGKQKAGKYRLLPFTSQFASNIEVNPAVNREVNPAVNREVKGDALFKQNEIETKEIENERDRLLNLFNSLNIKGGGTFGLDIVYSYIGVVDVEVIEMALKKSEKKHVNYFSETLNTWIAEGKTTSALVNPIPEPGSSGNRSYAARGSGKPKLAVVDSGPARKLSPEEREEMIALARKLRDENVRDG